MDRRAAVTEANLPSQARYRRWGILAAAALAYTLIQIRFSFEQYRLAQPPFYDDVAYFCDALRRLDVLYDQGFAPMLRSFVSTPSRSPYSCIMALSGFLLCGIKDWAPYLMNGLLVLVMLLCVDYLMRGARFWQRMVVCAIVLCIPLCGMMVLDCRPDLACGLAAAMAVLLPLRGGFVLTPWRWPLIAGAWCAAALICQPTTFPLTLVVVGIAWLGATICDRLADGQNFSVRRARRAWLIAIVPIVLLAAPVCLRDAPQVMQYMHDVFHGGGQRAGALFFISGFAGNLMFHHQLHLILIVLALGVIGVIVRMAADGHGQRIRLYRMIALGITCLSGYLIATLWGMSGPFAGAQFQILTILGMVMVLRMFLLHAGSLATKFFAVALLLICAWSAAGNTAFVVPWRAAATSPLVLDNTRVDQDVEKVLLEHAALGGKVFFTATGWLNCRTIEYLLRRDGATLDITDNILSGDPRLYESRMGWADFVVAAEAGVQEFDASKPGLDFEQSLRMIRERRDFAQIAAVTSASGRHFFIYQRIRPAAAAD
jgi:hypothetical protein